MAVAYHINTNEAQNIAINLPNVARIGDEMRVSSAGDGLMFRVTDVNTVPTWIGTDAVPNMAQVNEISLSPSVLKQLEDQRQQIADLQGAIRQLVEKLQDERMPDSFHAAATRLDSAAQLLRTPSAKDIELPKLMPKPCFEKGKNGYPTETANSIDTRKVKAQEMLDAKINAIDVMELNAMEMAAKETINGDPIAAMHYITVASQANELRKTILGY